MMLNEFAYAKKSSGMSACTRFLVTGVRVGEGRMLQSGVVWLHQSIDVTDVATNRTATFRYAQRRGPIATDRCPDDMELCHACRYFHAQENSTCAESDAYVLATTPCVFVAGELAHACINTPGRCFARTLVPCADVTHRHRAGQTLSPARIIDMADAARLRDATRAARARKTATSTSQYAGTLRSHKPRRYHPYEDADLV